MKIIQFKFLLMCNYRCKDLFLFTKKCILKSLNNFLHLKTLMIILNRLQCKKLKILKKKKKKKKRKKKKIDRDLNQELNKIIILMRFKWIRYKVILTNKMIN